MERERENVGVLRYWLSSHIIIGRKRLLIPVSYFFGPPFQVLCISFLFSSFQGENCTFHLHFLHIIPSVQYIFAHVKTACMVTAGMRRLSSLVLQAVTKASRQNTLELVQSLWHSRRITASHRGFRFSGSFGRQAGNV